MSTIETPNGYLLKELISGFQKYVRRGMEKEALYFGVEIDLAGYSEYLWKRMRIISSEDIGLAEPNMPANIWSLYELYTDQKKKNDKFHFPERLYLVHAILLIVRAKKSRVVDHALCVYYNLDRKDPAQRIELHDFCYDKHTAKGKAMGRGFDHFFSEGIKLENEVGDDPYLEDARRILISKEKKKPAPQTQVMDSRRWEPRSTQRQEENTQIKFFTDEVD